MGFSSITTQMIMFIAVMGMATGMIGVFQSYVDESSGAMSAQWEVMSNNVKTDITITNIKYRIFSIKIGVPWNRNPWGYQ